MKHIVLLGDSIFDNRTYVNGGKDTITNLREQRPEGWNATLLAIDGSVSDSVARQLPGVPQDATHIFVSVGGNDALGEMGILQMPTSSVPDVFNELSNAGSRFETRYKLMLDAVRALDKPTAVCTIYYPRYPDATMQKMAVAALASFNDVITRLAFLAGVPLIDLRYVCDEAADYANPIEPSVAGSAKIARTIIQVANEHAYQTNKTAVYIGSRTTRPDESSSTNETPRIGEAKTSQSHPIRVDFIRSEEFSILNSLGMTFAPGKKQSDAFSGSWNRDLGTDLERLADEFGTGTLISLLQDEELEELKISNLTKECGRVLINLVRFPIRDVSVPDSMDDFVLMIADAVESMSHGETVVTHCKGGLGRAGTTAACIVIAATDAAISASDAIDLVRRFRPGTVETKAQELFVATFENEWREVIANRGKDYLLYWQERSVQEHASNDLPLDVIASNQLMNIFPGDTIWIVTLTQERELVLAGRLVVSEVVEYEEAIRRMPDAELWQAEYYAFPEPGTEEYLREIDIQHLAEDLRFDSENDRFILHDGKVNPQQLQSIRKLTRPSAVMLDEAFYTTGPIGIDELDPETMLNVTRQLAEITPDDSDAQYNFGVALGRNEMYEEEIKAYQRTLDLNPGYFGAQYNLGNVFIRLGRFEEAVEAFNKAILISGEYPPAHFMLGVAYFESGRFKDAVAATRQGLEIDPADERAHHNIAYWTFLQGDYRGALARCDDVIARFPYYTSTYLLKGICFRELGELENEIRSYKEAVNIKVDDEGALIINFTAIFFLGAAWERKITGNDEGIEYIEADTHLDLQDPTHQFCMAMGHLAQGEREFAAQWIESLWTSAPDLAQRLEAALNHEEFVISETHSGRTDMSGETQPEEWPRQDYFAGGDQPVELEQTGFARKGQPRKLIQINVGGTDITAKHNPDLYFQVLKLLVERRALDSLDLPISSGRKRNFLSRTPIHKDGSNFLAPVDFGGYYMESHSSREQGIKMLRAFLENLGIESSVFDERESSSEPVENLRVPSFHERVLGSILGLAVCDALGTTAEFKPTGSFPEITSMLGGGPFALNPGEWTDDTSMALCLADSLIETGGFNASDQMDRYLRWKNEGYLSSNGVAFDIGTTIRAALEKYQSDEGGGVDNGGFGSGRSKIVRTKLPSTNTPKPAPGFRST